MPLAYMLHVGDAAALPQGVGPLMCGDPPRVRADDSHALRELPPDETTCKRYCFTRSERCCEIVNLVFLKIHLTQH